VAAVAAAAEHVPLAAAPAAGAEGCCASACDDAAELTCLVLAAHLLGAAEVAAADEDLREGDAARGAREESGELLDVTRVHGYVALVDGGAEPAQDGAHGAAVLIRAPDDVERGEVEHDAAVGLGGGGRRRSLEGAERAEGGRGDADAVEDTDGGGARRGRRRGRGGVGVQERLDILEGGGGEGHPRGGGGERSGGGGAGGASGGWGGGRPRLHPRQPHGGRWAAAGDGEEAGFVRFSVLEWRGARGVSVVVVDFWLAPVLDFRFSAARFGI
jgi:hypothetical protein